jgi:maleylacetate reductase
MLPAVLAWNAAVNGERQRALSEAMAAPDRPASALIAELVAALDQPGSLRAVGIAHGELDVIAERALSYPQLRINPRPVTTAAQVREILELAW